MKEIFETIAEINAAKNSNYSIVTCAKETKLITKGLEKAQQFLSYKMPEEFIEFYSHALCLTLITTKKTKYYEKDYEFDNFFSLVRAFDNFKVNPDRIESKTNDYVKVKKAFPCSRYLPLECNESANFNEITRQKIMVSIPGTGNAITVDFYENNKSGYTLNYLDTRNSTLYPIELSLTDFLSYYIYFGTTNYWFFPFIKSKTLMVNNLNELKGLFGGLKTHLDKIEEIEKRMAPHCLK